MIAEGHYARKQICCQNQIIAWSHASRFQTMQKMLAKYASNYQNFLDYGCGDATFINMVSHLFTDIVGTDISESQINDCRQRLSQEEKIKFCLTNQINRSEYTSYFDVAVCMEVLEHCLTAQRDKVIMDLQRVVKKDGLIIISVPIEIGPSLFIKEITRTVAAWLRQGDYDKSLEPYSTTEMLKMIFANKSSSIQRPVYGNDSPYHGHKGFNWRSLRHDLSQQLEIEQTFFSPLGWLGGLVSSQVFLICRNR
ncbi:MAG: class I SAM-dependent methyltransferase [Nostocaceae cyanobacterium]|nr:class I SAM-dependent methyltransferase [Nostocaceae cyanobacterium]